MKGQISFVELLVTMSIFTTFIGYFSFQLINFYPIYLNEVRNEELRSEAYQLSELLINDIGEPGNWTGKYFAYVSRVGLSDENYNKTNYLSLMKISDFDSNCSSDYNLVKSKLASSYDFSIYLFQRYPIDKQLIDCKPPVITVSNINVTVRRIVYFGSGYGELVVQMW